MSGRTRLVAMATAVVLGYLPASAQEQEGRVFDTGNDLWSHCSGKGDAHFGLCAGFVVGIADAMSNVTGILGRRACIPLPVSRGQAIDVVKQFLEQHPEKRHETAVSLAAEALAGAFPCKP
jgi:hypothetical protein